MGIQIYNTLTRKKEPFETIEPNKVRMYVCGVTVYNKAHLGHAYSALVFDILRRYLEFRGYDVKYAMNFTDVDDKIIRRAAELNMDPFQLAQKYIDELKRNMADLNIKPATFNPRATEEIPQIIAMINGLIEKGHAYPMDGDVYFRVRTDPEYGKLSGRKLDDMRVGVRKDADDRKEDPMDFALWKAAKPGEPAWISPWGEGRPGWHIECSAMSWHHLGESIDIHGGGNDLVFPHHENEIAQTECFTGKKFARYWVHNGMMQLRGEKMSKSLGNIISIDDFLATHSADALRYVVLNASYRNPIIFDEDVFAQAEKSLDRMRFALKPAMTGAKGAPIGVVESLNAQTIAVRDGFIASMDDDFNTAGALGQLFELVRSINFARDANATDAELIEAQSLLRDLTAVWGLRLDLARDEKEGTGAEPFVELLIALRLEMRKEKLWALADRVRDQLKEHGVILEDTKEGTTWHWA